MSSLTAQNEGASSEHLHACSNTLSPHNTNAWPLTAPMLAVLTDTASGFGSLGSRRCTSLRLSCTLRPTHARTVSAWRVVRVFLFFGRF